MSHARVTHPTRETLDFNQGQNDEYGRQAVISTNRGIGTDRLPIVNTETREANRTVRGSVTGREQARVDAATSDYRQALANYADRLEAAVDEYQGDPGYTLVDDQLGYSRTGIIESVTWSLTPGRPDELDYELTFIEGEGVFQEEPIDRRKPSYDTKMDVYLRIDGEDLPGMRSYQVERSITATTNARFDRDSAENNDIVIDEGPQRRVTFEGMLTGDPGTRETKDKTLESKVGTKNNLTLETKFPGYDLDVFVATYQSTLEQQRAGNAHRYRMEMVEGERA